jgi:hypothetical protein
LAEQFRYFEAFRLGLRCIPAVLPIRDRGRAAVHATSAVFSVGHFHARRAAHLQSVAGLEMAGYGTAPWRIGWDCPADCRF